MHLVASVFGLQDINTGINVVAVVLVNIFKNIVTEFLITVNIHTVQVKMMKIMMCTQISHFGDFIVTHFDNFQTIWWIKGKQLCQIIVRCIKFQQCRHATKCRQIYSYQQTCHTSIIEQAFYNITIQSNHHIYFNNCFPGE